MHVDVISSLNDCFLVNLKWISSDEDSRGRREANGKKNPLIQALLSGIMRTCKWH